MALLLRRVFEFEVDEFADAEEALPVGLDGGDGAGDDVADLGEEREVDAGGAVGDGGEILPDLVGGEAEDGRDKAGEGFGDAPDGGLGGAARGGVGREGVEAVFGYVEVERAEVGVGELVQGLVGAVELELVVGLAHGGVEFGGAGEDVAVEGLHLGPGDGVGGGREVVQIAQEEAEGVAQLAVVLADAAHQVFAGDDVFAEVDARRPRGG